jgi:hypothetical protein
VFIHLYHTQLLCENTDLYCHLMLLPYFDIVCRYVSVLFVETIFLIKYMLRKCKGVLYMTLGYAASSEISSLIVAPLFVLQLCTT